MSTFQEAIDAIVLALDQIREVQARLPDSYAKDGDKAIHILNALVDADLKIVRQPGAWKRKQVKAHNEAMEAMAPKEWKSLPEIKPLERPD